MNMMGISGMAIAMLSGILLYLASPNQLLWDRQLPSRLLALSGTIFASASLVLLLQWAGAATAIFILVTLVMLVWTFVPLAAAWRQGDRKIAKKGRSR